jgi:molecular chaperone DnaK
VSIVSFGDGGYEVLATAGDDRLGGDDFDRIIVDFLREEIKKRVGASVELDRTRQLILLKAATQAKINLSSTLSARIHIPGFLSSVHQSYDLDVSLDRDTFEVLGRGLFRRAEAVLKTAIGDLKSASFQDVLLIGGTSRMPHIRESVRQITGMEPCAGVDSLIGIAQGASILAACLSGEIKIVLVDAVPTTYSIEEKDGVLHVVVPRNTRIPIRKTHQLTAAKDGPTDLTVRVYQGEKPTVDQNIFIGDLRLSGLSPELSGVADIEIAFDIDVNNTLKVSARDKATGRQVEAMMQALYRLNPKHIKHLQSEAEYQLKTIWREWEAAGEVERSEAERANAQVFVGQVEGFLAAYLDLLDVEHVRLLESGKQIIKDYLSWYASPKALKAQCSDVRATYQAAAIALVRDFRSFQRHRLLFLGQVSDTARRPGGQVLAGALPESDAWRNLVQVFQKRPNLRHGMA